MALEKSGLCNYDPKLSMEFINTECVMYRQNITALSTNASKYRHLSSILFPDYCRFYIDLVLRDGCVEL